MLLGNAEGTLLLFRIHLPAPLSVHMHDAQTKFWPLVFLSHFGKLVPVALGPESDPHSPGGPGLSDHAGRDVLQHVDLPGCDRRLCHWLLPCLPTAQRKIAWRTLWLTGWMDAATDTDL